MKWLRSSWQWLKTLARKEDSLGTQGSHDAKNAAYCLPAMSVEELQTEIFGACEKANSVVSKDLPRLTKRITITSNQSDCVEGLGEASAPRVIWDIARLTDEASGDLREAVDRLAVECQGRDDTQGCLSRFFDDSFTRSSRTFGVLRTMHQGIVLPVAVFLRSQSPDIPHTKDVRGPRGWHIHVQADGELCTVTHVRKEQSLHCADDLEHFSYEWELALELRSSVGMSSSYALQRMSLRILDVEFHQQAPLEYKESVARVGLKPQLLADAPYHKCASM